MKLVLLSFLSFFSVSLLAQEEIVSPLGANPHITKKNFKTKSGNSIDSSFIYNIDTLDLPVWDDFSINKFLPYDSDYTDGNVSSQWYYQLMNSTNTVPQNPAFKFCDSLKSHHDTIAVTAGIPSVYSYYFPTVQSVWVNNLNAYPVNGVLMNLYQECYVLVDSVIDGVPDPDQDTIWYTSNPDYVQDSANVFFVDYNDPNKIWVDDFAYHNYSYAKNPWSLGVATFDGLNENGWPYDFGNMSAHESADVLTSRPINLAGKTDVYLTFLYQSKGYGNAPETEDSLLLEWWLPDSNAWWPSQWYALGGEALDTWDTGYVAVTVAALDDGFRFRFRNWASTSGALDHWHIDYVNLEDNGLPTVSNFSDLAVSEPIHTLLDDYTAVPWDHFKNANASEKMIDTLKVKVYNSDLTPTNYANGGLEIRFGGILQGGSPFVLANPAITSEWTGNWEMGLNKYPYPLAANYTYNNSVTALPKATFDVKLNIDAAVSGANVFDVNDTTYFTQKFDNFYSYDDGSAEAAYGVTGSHSLLAYQFEAYEEDTLTGILIHWVPSVDDHSDKLFLLTIWNDNAGQPGTIIYQDDYFNTSHPEYSGAINGFRYYTFMNDQNIVVPEKFYVGWEQIESVSLNVGLDLNLDNSHRIFRNVSGTWQTSSYDASLLIRPVYSTALNYTLDLTEPENTDEISVSVYPNPVKNVLTVQTNLYSVQYSVYDMTGREVLSGNEKEIEMSDLNSGVYIVQIKDSNGLSLYSGKVIKE